MRPWIEFDTGAKGVFHMGEQLSGCLQVDADEAVVVDSISLEARWWVAGTGIAAGPQQRRTLPGGVFAPGMEHRWPFVLDPPEALLRVEGDDRQIHEWRAEVKAGVVLADGVRVSTTGIARLVAVPPPGSNAAFLEWGYREAPIGEGAPDEIEKAAGNDLVGPVSGRAPAVGQRSMPWRLAAGAVVLAVVAIVGYLFGQGR